MTYHQFSFKNFIKVIIAEPQPQRFFWLSIYLDKKLRNKKLSKEIIKYLLVKLGGKHEIHWNVGLTTLNQLAKKYRWKINKTSDVYLNCQSTTIEKIQDKLDCWGLFAILLKHKSSLRCPKLVNYASIEDKRLIITSIKKKYSHV